MQQRACQTVALAPAVLNLLALFDAVTATLVHEVAPTPLLNSAGTFDGGLSASTAFVTDTPWSCGQPARRIPGKIEK